jgi:prolipoprotein diacylglyceryltransferase
MFSHESYPSYGVFSITSIATYLGLATKEFTPTLNAMGPEWTSRSTVAYVFIGLVLAAFIGARLWSCDGLGEILAAFTMAIISGAIFFFINKAVFGEEAMNFLGLPYMVSKESQGSPIYVCAANA